VADDKQEMENLTSRLTVAKQRRRYNFSVDAKDCLLYLNQAAQEAYMQSLTEQKEHLEKLSRK